MVFYSLSLSLSLSLSCVLCKSKLSIKPAFSVVRFYTCFRTLFFSWYQSARVENLCSRHSLKGKPTKKNRKNRWIEAWLARFRRRSSTEITTHLGLTRGMVTGAMSTQLMTQHPDRHTEISRRGNSRRAEYCSALCLVWANNS